MDEKYSIGAISRLITGDSNKALVNLFTESKKQKGPYIQSPLKKTKDSKSSFKKEEQEKKESNDVHFETPSLRSLVKSEDNKKRVKDEDKDKRTLFIGNVSIRSSKKKIIMLFKKYGDIESVRLRGAARPDVKATKKIAIITKSIHEKRSNILAYVCFRSPESVSKALEEKGSFELDGHILQIDTSTPSLHEAQKAVFIGNLELSAEENELRSHFEECGPIQSLRIIRDSKTGMGKGFAYVNFTKADSVEKALLRHHSEFRGRPLRVSRCVRKPKKSTLIDSNIRQSKGRKSIGGKKRPKTLQAKSSNSFCGFQNNDDDDEDRKMKSQKRKSKTDKRKEIFAKKLQHHTSHNKH